jgi:nucleotide-binding universal stress UspA family protein
MTQPKATTVPFRNIAVATDFTMTSDHAVRLASAFATKCAAELTVVNVVEPAAYPQIGADTAALKAIAQGTLDANLVRVRDDVPGATGVLLVGRPAEELIAFAETTAIDLVVSGTHGRKSVDRWLVGSVAAKLVRSCHAPVLIVHDTAPDLRRLLVATDFGPASERAVEVAAQLAKTYGARITLLHAVGVETPTDSLDSARARLEEIAVGVRKLAPECDVVERRGHTWSEIADEAARGGYDLVVVGTHDRSPLFMWLRGSVAEQVLRASLPPVLSVRARPMPAPQRSDTPR